MFNHRIHLSEEIKQIRKDALTWLPEPLTISHPSFIRQDNDGEMKGFPGDGQMWRRKEEKPENEAERRLPYSNSPLRVYPPHFLQLNFGAVAGSAEGENARLNRAGREGAQNVPADSTPLQGAAGTPGDSRYWEQCSRLWPDPGPQDSGSGWGPGFPQPAAGQGAGLGTQATPEQDRVTGTRAGSLGEDLEL